MGGGGHLQVQRVPSFVQKEDFLVAPHYMIHFNYCRRSTDENHHRCLLYSAACEGGRGTQLCGHIYEGFIMKAILGVNLDFLIHI